jgi:hypothetical protein
MFSGELELGGAGWGARYRHDKKGGRGWGRGRRCGRQCQGRHLHPQALAQGLYRATGRIAHGAERVTQYREYHMHPVIRLRLTHPEHAPMERLQCMLCEIDQNEQQTIGGCRQWAVLIGRVFS